MTPLITDAITQTYVVAGVLLTGLLLTIHKRHGDKLFPPEATTELKGLAILFIVLSHIGYFLVSDNRFLVPMSNFAGVGVDLFLILSGYGLAASALQKPLSAWHFYTKRLIRIYLPVIATVLLFLGLDYFILNTLYPAKTIWQSLIGFFPRGDLYRDLNSPLWFITPLLVYYLLFPLTFWRRAPIVSAALLAIAGWYFIKHNPFDLINLDLLKTYKLHFLAFPIGLALAPLLNREYHLKPLLRWLGVALATLILVYTLNHTHVGEVWKREALTSTISALTFIALFVFKPFNNKLLLLIGIFSFEVYLLHWPILSRYDFLYGRVPAGAATLGYLIIFLGLGYVFQKGTTYLTRFRVAK